MKNKIITLIVLVFFKKFSKKRGIFEKKVVYKYEEAKWRKN